MSEPHWGEFEQRKAAVADDSVAQCAARLFMGPDGQDLLAFLRRETKERALGPEASDGALRYLEGQRALVQRIETLIDRGLKALQAKK